MFLRNHRRTRAGSLFYPFFMSQMPSTLSLSRRMPAAHLATIEGECNALPGRLLFTQKNTILSAQSGGSGVFSVRAPGAPVSSLLSALAAAFCTRFAAAALALGITLFRHRRRLITLCTCVDLRLAHTRYALDSCLAVLDGPQVCALGHGAQRQEPILSPCISNGLLRPYTPHGGAGLCHPWRQTPSASHHLPVSTNSTSATIAAPTRPLCCQLGHKRENYSGSLRPTIAVYFRCCKA
jgi:hypothetical protein